MMLLAPGMLWLSVVGVAVVALYLLKIRRRHQLVPALEFWLELLGQTQVRSLFRRLKRWLSLCLWLAIVALLILAAGNPVVTLGTIRPESIVLVVDNSASMQSVEETREGKTRLELAVAAVHDILARRPVHDEWMLIEAGRQPKVRQAWTRDRKSIGKAADAISGSVVSADLDAAIELTSKLLRDKQAPRIVLVSDGAAGLANQLVNRDPRIVYWPVGQTRDNLGVTRISVRTHRQQSTHYALIELANASQADVQTQLVFEIDGVTTKVEPVTVAAGGTWEKTIPFHAPQGGVLRASIDRSDALGADNHAFAILQPIDAVSVCLVTQPRDAFFFQRAIEAMDTLIDHDASRIVTADEYGRTRFDHPAALTIFNGSGPQTAPRGPSVFVNCWPADLPINSLGTIDRPELTVVNRNHPINHYLNLGAVAIARAHRLELLQNATVLAESSDGAPLVFLVEQPDRQCLCLGFDVLASDLPFRNAFPILLRNALSFLVAERMPAVRDQYQPGDVIEPLRAVDPHLSEMMVTHLYERGVETKTVGLVDGAFAYSDTAAVGALRFTLGDEVAYTAVNLSDENESRIAPVPASVSPDGLVLTEGVGGVAPWLALAVLGGALLALEWLTYHMRWTE